jgi:hypothetical protein
VDCDGTLVPQQGELVKASYSSASAGLIVSGMSATSFLKGLRQGKLVKASYSSASAGLTLVCRVALNCTCPQASQ